MNSTISSRLNLELLDSLYAQWCANPQSVSPDWSCFFEGFELGLTRAEEEPSPPNPTLSTPSPTPAPATTPAPSSSASYSEDDLIFFGRIVSLIYNYRTLGHTQSHINPLDETGPRNPRLELSQFALSPADHDRIAWSAYFRKGERMPLHTMIETLESTYSGKIGFEFMHIHHTPVRHWVRDRIENHPRTSPHSTQQKLNALKWILEAEAFENFLGKRFLGEKRFSNEGGEGVMILLNALLEACPSHGVKEIEMGMSHRGRMCVLANFVRKSLTTVFREFSPNYEPDLVAGDGDVKYHLGYESIRQLPDGEVRISLAANPSHLEAVNPIVEGKARARQRILSEGAPTIDRNQVLPLILHGDAAFAGQGSVAEVLNLSQLPGYRTGGTIHIIINNQIGFTTMPEDARSSAYATDVAKMIEAPILHVNGEEPTELFWAAQFAIDFREQFGRDVVIDMYCYRRQGHNEMDQAAFTQPLVTRKISDRPTFPTLYKNRLIAEGLISPEEVSSLESSLWNHFEEGYNQMLALHDQPNKSAFSGSTAVAQSPYVHQPIHTGTPLESLVHIGKTLTQFPPSFSINPTLAKRLIPRRASAIQDGERIDWALAEALAFGSLLLEQIPVRLSGQDVGRGTFSHRHAVMHDSLTNEKFVALEHLSPNQAKFCIHNSLLSEFAVLGFDYGYSLAYPKMLTLWEAQFGDFANGAQVIIDQFISSSESKWQVPTDLVMLLPHGYEGMGPEHSSARLERFLQLCADDNLIVGNFTTPAQYFHALRRQKHQPYRKPLIIMTPKSLLGHPEAVSSLDELATGSCFQEVLPDPVFFDDPSQITRIVFCSGKVFYDLLAARNESNCDHTAIIRIEQLYPFHHKLVAAITSDYPNANHFVWCQEEPANMGAWSFIKPLLEHAIQHPLSYAGRDEASSPAAGSKATHYREQKRLVASALGLNPSL